MQTTIGKLQKQKYMGTINVNGKEYKKVDQNSYAVDPVKRLWFEGCWYRLIEKKRDWQILEVQTMEGKITSPDLIEGLVGYHNITITKVKRLSDGEVFSIGDKIQTKHITYFEIKTIRIKDGIVCLSWLDLIADNPTKVKKQKLFTTVDGKDIYEGDEFYINDNERNRINLRKGGDGLACEIEEIRTRCYSTKEAAMFAMPCLSLNDIIDCYKKYDSDFKEEEPTRFPVYPIIKKLAEQKINN